MKWTRNDREVWYLSVVFLVSLGLSLLSVPMLIQFGILFEFGILFAPFLIILPHMPHMPAYVYGVHIREGQTSRIVSGYRLALIVSILTSLYVSVHVVLMLIGLPPMPPVWYHEVVVVSVVLLVPTYHAYTEYNKHEDFIQIVMLFMVYAPWAQFIRLFTGYMRFV